MVSIRTKVLDADYMLRVWSGTGTARRGNEEIGDSFLPILCNLWGVIFPDLVGYLLKKGHLPTSLLANVGATNLIWAGLPTK